MTGMGANILDTLSTIAGRVGSNPVTQATQTLQTAQQQLPRIEKKIEDSLDVAEVWVVSSLGLQAIAAFAAVGMLIVHVKSYNRRYHPRGGILASNPRRKRRKR